MIPYKLFVLLAEAIDTMDAVEEVTMSRAVSLGYVQARDGKNPRLKNAQRALIRRAFPEEYT